MEIRILKLKYYKPSGSKVGAKMNYFIGLFFFNNNARRKPGI
jgi:hypothetical protein